MVNPILAMLQPRSPSGGNNILNTVAMLKNIMQGGDPAQLVAAQMQQNPQFAAFVQRHQGMSIDDLLREAGLDPATISTLLK